MLVNTLLGLNVQDAQSLSLVLGETFPIWHVLISQSNLRIVEPEGDF